MQPLKVLGTKERFLSVLSVMGLQVLVFLSETTYKKYVEIRQFTEAKQIILFYNLFSNIKKFIDFRLYKFNWNKVDA